MLTVDRAGPIDVEALAALKYRVEDDTYSSYGTEDEHRKSLAIYASPDYVDQLLASGPVLAARSAGQIVGMVALREKGDLLVVHSLYCAVAGRRTGTLLLCTAIRACPGASAVEVEVFEANDAALGFFVRRGFRPSGSSRPSASYAGQRLLTLRVPADHLRQLCEDKG